MDFDLGDFWPHEGYEAHVPGAMRAAAFFDEVFHRDAGPRHRHRPRFDAAKAVKSFFERQRANQLVDIEDARFFDETGHFNLPRRGFQSRRLLVNTAFEDAKLVEIIVRGRVDLFRDRSIENETRGAVRRIQVKRRRLFLARLRSPHL